MRHARFNRNHSITSKLVLTFILIAIVFVVLVSSSISHVFRTHFEHNIKPHLIQYMEYVQADIGIPADRARAKALAERLHINIQISDQNGAWSSNGKTIDSSKAEIRHKITENGIDYGIAEIAGKEYFMSRQNGVTFLFDIPNLHPKHRGRGLLPIIVLLIILLLLYHFTHRIIRPVSVLKAGIQKIGAGDLTHRISINRRDELGELADSINAMADDIQKMLESKRQLLLAISHELRSPLTRAKVSLELIDNSEQIASLSEDLNEMEKLIEELLETERLSGRHKIINRQETELGDYLSTLLKQRAEFADVQLTLPTHEVTAQLDRARIKLLVNNLLHNAVKHTPASAPPPEIMLEDDEQNITIVVTDFGAGIEPQHLPHVTEPFYRADSSRSRETGGFGLGLYLCRMIAEAHQGRLEIASEVGSGTTIRVTLPRG